MSVFTMPSSSISQFGLQIYSLYDKILIFHFINFLSSIVQISALSSVEKDVLIWDNQSTCNYSRKQSNKSSR